MTAGQMSLDVGATRAVHRMETGANLSPCGAYRYTLLRRWEPKGPCLRWVMLNPSTADAETDDPTIRRVIRFSRDAGYSACVVANLFALRATDPAELARHPAPVGPDNDAILGALVRAARTDAWRTGRPPSIAVAWGASAPGDRVAAVLAGPLEDVPLVSLGVTKAGHPRHPLYVPSTQRLDSWAAA